MVNKPPWHIRDFVFASYTFDCMEMSDFEPNNRHLWESWIFFFHLKKKAAEMHQKLQKVYRDTALSKKNEPWLMIGFVASNTMTIQMLTTVCVKENQNFLKKQNWRHLLMRISAKRKKSLFRQGVTC